MKQLKADHQLGLVYLTEVSKTDILGGLDKIAKERNPAYHKAYFTAFIDRDDGSLDFYSCDLAGTPIPDGSVFVTDQAFRDKKETNDAANENVFYKLYITDERIAAKLQQLVNSPAMDDHLHFRWSTIETEPLNSFYNKLYKALSIRRPLFI